MSGSSKEFIAYILELLAPIDAMTSGRFFGGVGIACDSVQFAMIMGNSLFFVVDDTSRPKYLEMGTECFWYSKKTGKVNVKKYHEVPGDLFDDPETLISWANESVAVARKLNRKKK